MTAYHINPKTGNVGQCRAKKSCPFGGKDEHFPDETEARQFYEDRMLAHKFQAAKKSATGRPGIVPVNLRLAYVGMMARRTADELKDDAVTEAIIRSTEFGFKEKPAGPKGGNLVEGVKKVGLILKSVGSLVKLPFVRSSAARLIGAAGAAGALLSPAGLAIGGGVAAVGGAVALGYFGKKAFSETRRALLNKKHS